VAHAVAVNRSVAEVAAAHRIGWSTAQACVDEHADMVLTEPEPTPVLGIDETRRGKPRWDFDAPNRRWVRTDRWDTGFVAWHEEGTTLSRGCNRTVIATSARGSRSSSSRPSRRRQVKFGVAEVVAGGAEHLNHPTVADRRASYTHDADGSCG
jgi:hypothetical protein